VSDPPDKPGPDSPEPPAAPARPTITQPLAPVEPGTEAEGPFETTGSFQTGASGVPVIDAPFPVATPPPAPPRPPAPRPAARPPSPPAPGAPPRSSTGSQGLPAAGTRPPVPSALPASGARPAAPAGAPGAGQPPVVPGSPQAARAAAPPGAPRPPGAPPRAPSRELPATGAATRELLTAQAHAAGLPPQPGVLPAKIFRPTPTGPAGPPLPSLGVNIAPVIPPIAPLPPVARGGQKTVPPRVPHSPTRDPMSETSLGIPVMPPLPPLDVEGAPAVPPVAPLTAAAPPADPEAQLAWKAERLDLLDYFELLGVPTTASAVEVKRAFYKESRAYHPDRFFHLTDEAFKAQVHEVYKRVTEAYYVLRDDVRRKKYLADVTGPDRARKLRFDELSEAETKAAVKQQAAEQIGLNPKARQLFQTGVAEAERGSLAAAERSLKMALTYEPQNALYKEKLKEVQDRLYEESRGKAFKIT